MKIALGLCRIIVGLLFIFSGLVKANDPHGLSYKMHEFFEIWDLTRFNSWTLLFSILMNAFEIIAGFALLLGWRIKLFSWLLLLLILFFTFLTGYTYVTGKPTNCGCFGDCLPISSKVSFLKDVALTILIAFIFYYRNHIKPVFSEKTTTITMLLITILSFGMQWYALNYLPFVDCLPFKTGNNIPEQMKMPANAIPDSTVITFVYEKDGNQIEFTSTGFPKDFDSKTYTFISRYDKIIRKGSNNEPPIKGFSLSGVTNIDSTMEVLGQPQSLILFVEDFSTPLSKWQDDFEEIYVAARNKNIPVFIVTNRMDEALQKFSSTKFSDVPVFKCDYTAIRTAARTIPCLYYLKDGTVVDKWSHKKMKDVMVHIERTIPSPPKIPEQRFNPVDSL